jgi:predicted nucleic acid-binding protein
MELARPRRLELLPDALSVSVITIGELRAGVLAASDLETRNRRLVTLTHALGLEPIPIDEPVADTWALLRVQLRAGACPSSTPGLPRPRSPTACLSSTRDQDYVDLPGLGVIRI